ncbi:hypothetical protein Tco_0697799 [Tanacetum coccineum]
MFVPCIKYKVPTGQAPGVEWCTDDVTGYSCPELEQKYRPAHTQKTPIEILLVEGQKNVFQFHFNITSYVTDFTLDSDFEKKEHTGVRSRSQEEKAGTSAATATSKDPDTYKEGPNKQPKDNPTKRPLFPNSLS